MLPQLKPAQIRRLPIVHQTLPSIKSLSDEVLVAIAVLGLVAALADGKADIREVECFVKEFRNSFALSRKHSNRLIDLALKRINENEEAEVIDKACDTLNEYLEAKHKMNIFRILAKILIADKFIHYGEEYYLEYVASRLYLNKSYQAFLKN